MKFMEADPSGGGEIDVKHLLIHQTLRGHPSPCKDFWDTLDMIDVSEQGAADGLWVCDACGLMLL